MDTFVVIYAKITTGETVELQGVYLGGTAKDKQEAEQIAKNCINTIRGGTILPKIAALNGNLIDVMYEVSDKFEYMIKQMQESHNILQKSSRRK